MTIPVQTMGNDNQLTECVGAEVEDGGGGGEGGGGGGGVGQVILESGCFKPETPANGEMFVLWSGLLIQFRCPTEFKLVGAGAIICRNRTWTQEPPVCQPSGQLLSGIFFLLDSLLDSLRHFELPGLIQ